MRKKEILAVANPKLRTNMGYFNMFRTALYVTFIAVFIASCTKEIAKDQPVIETQAVASIAETFPANLADTVVVNPVVAVTFKSATDPVVLAASSITLKQGTIPVQGTVSFSGTTATFTPVADLTPNTEYKATVITSTKNSSGKNIESEHSWTFKTGSKHDEHSSFIVSVLPLKNAVSVPVTVKPSATFGDKIKSSEITSSTFILKQGLTKVDGTVSFSGKTATFNPASSLKPSTVYTAMIKSGDDDGDDDWSDSEKSYKWSFTTGGGVTDVTAPTITSVLPVNNTTGILVNSKATVVFSEAMNPTTINSATFTLKQGTTSVAGTISYSGTTATFTPASALAANTIYLGTITTGAKDAAGNAIAENYTWSFTTAAAISDVTPPTVLSVVPLNNATLVAVSSKATVTFSEAMNSSTINTSTFLLKQGTTAVAGTVAYSGTTATFTPSASLMANKVYTGTITTGAKDAAGNAIASIYTWSFTTTAAADVTPPTVLSAIPANSAMNVATSIHPSVTFSESMDATTINAASFTLKQGSTAVAGSVAYSGTTATFTPSAGLAANTMYTGTITTGAKDAAGNAIVSNFTWSFTTAAAADVTPPTVLTIVPASGATSIAINSIITATFSEAMNSSTLNASTFTLKQGTTTVAGAVSYSGTTATFTPTAPLSGGVVYTATITTGAMDAAGNAIAAVKTWSFTTVAAAPVVSFATQVMPILQSKCTPCHGANGPSAGISITNYSTVSALSNSQLDNSRMYPKMGVTAAEQAIIKAWIAAGRLNN